MVVVAHYSSRQPFFSEFLLEKPFCRVKEPYWIVQWPKTVNPRVYFWIRSLLWRQCLVLSVIVIISVIKIIIQMLIVVRTFLKYVLCVLIDCECKIATMIPKCSVICYKIQCGTIHVIKSIKFSSNNKM